MIGKVVPTLIMVLYAAASIEQLLAGKREVAVYYVAAIILNATIIFPQAFYPEGLFRKWFGG